MSRVIVAGSRVIKDYTLVERIIFLADAIGGIKITTLVSGMAQGVDLLAVKWANQNNIPVEPHPYKSQFGKAGGPIRNQEMAEASDALIAIWNGDLQNSGTYDMITKWRALNGDNNLFIYNLKTHNK